MTTLISLHILLILHLTGLALMAGTTVAEYVTFKTFARLFITEKEQSRSVLDLIKKLSVLLATGAALLIVSGTGLLIITQGVFLKQIWFQIKSGLIITLVLNGFLTGARQELKLRNNIDTDVVKSMEAIRKLKIFHLVQISLLFTIIFLSVFKFS